MNRIYFLIYKVVHVVLFRRFFPVYKILYFLYKRVWDRKRLSRFRRLVKPGMTVLDIGANIGFYTLFFSDLVGPEGRVYAFEPDELNFKYLKHNAEHKKNVVFVPRAVTEKTGEIRLYRSEVNNADCKTYDSGENRKSSAVQGVAIDDYFQNGEKVNVIKMDVQGYEYFALKGMPKTIARSPQVLMAGEFWPFALQKSGADPKAFIELLENSGFKIEFEKGLSQGDVLGKTHDYFFYCDFLASKE